MLAKLEEWEIIAIMGAIRKNHHNNRRNDINLHYRNTKVVGW